MITLNSNPLASTSTKTDHTKAEETQSVSNAVSSEPTTTETSSPQTVFSSRAEKLAQINKEFDITGADFHISQQFINRLSEIGLISTSEATDLNQGLPLSSNGAKETESITALKSSLESIAERINGKEGTSSLLTLLENSQKILDNLDGSQSKTFPVDPATAAAELDHYLKSDGSNILTVNEKQSLADLKTALTIADKLSPEQRTSAQVSKYMEILNRYG